MNEPAKQLRGRTAAIMSTLEAIRAVWERDWREAEKTNPGRSLRGSVMITASTYANTMLQCQSNPEILARNYKKHKHPNPAVRPNSKHFYAQYIQNLDGIVACHIVEQDFENIVRGSIEIGALIAEFILRSTMESPALRAMENDDELAVKTRCANDARRTEGARRHAYWQKLADPIWSDHPDWSNTDVARHIVKEKGTGKVGTIRRIIRRREK